jgi:Flp pilus assembly protein TadG
VELALVLPVLLMLVFGAIEVGRLMSTYATVVSATREAARYGSAVGENEDGVARYRDCAGMRGLATAQGMRSSGLLVINPVDQVDVVIRFDAGPGAETWVAQCPPGNGNASNTVVRGHRVVVTVSRNFEPMLPLVNNFGPFTVSATDRRTIGGRAL